LLTFDIEKVIVFVTLLTISCTQEDMSKDEKPTEVVAFVALQDNNNSL